MVNTTNTIHGSAPYLTFDGGQTKATDTDSFLAIELPNGRVIKPSTNTSSLANPIMVSAGITFNDIHMVLPLDSDSISLNDLITQGKWGDDDGDGQGAGEVTASGSISLVIKDKDGTTVSRGDTLNLCKAPYKVTLSSAGGNLVTQYGVPNSSTFSGGRADYYITLPSQPVICSVRPNLLLGGTTGIDSRDNPRYAGPSNIWSPTKGFFVQSASPSSYDLNFPTTGADGLYFDLDIGGIDGSQLRWTVNTSGSIRATVSRVGSSTTRVTLSGPKADSSQISSSSPGRISVPSLPQTFELVGRDSNGNEVRYGFVLRQWFVHRGAQEANASTQTAWCNSLGYRLARVRDLTNASCSGWGAGSWCQGAVGATPSSSNNGYKRHIGAGFFTEWGNMDYYADAGFVRDDYWTSDATGSDQFPVFSYDGYVDSYSASESRYGLCTAP
ncbi:hypothetical protein A9G39_06255 [Gilliamella sp. Imp1-6]|nr:hypothetical protein A9G39_06255 [Gilliamella apicola]